MSLDDEIIVEPIPDGVDLGIGAYDQDAAEGQYIFRVQLELAKALAHRMKTHRLSRKKLAKILDLDKSTISRMLAGNANLTSRSIGALCFAMDAEPKFSIDFHDDRKSNGKSAPQEGQHISIVLPMAVTITGQKSNARQSSTQPVTKITYTVIPEQSPIAATSSKGMELRQ